MPREPAASQSIFAPPEYYSLKELPLIFGQLNDDRSLAREKYA